MKKWRFISNNEKGMEMVQVGNSGGDCDCSGADFQSEITSFVNKTFESLNSGF